MNKLDILSMSYHDIKDKAFDYVILPWGAIEPHNYHLPYLTDCYLAHDVAVDAVNKAYDKFDIRGIVLPPVALGSQNPGQFDMPFCLHGRYETQKAILTDIVASLHRQGINKLVIVNGHGGNNFKNMIRDLTLDYPDFFIASNNWFSFIPQAGYFEEKDDHAGELETSVLMYYRPELVDLSVAGDGTYHPFVADGLRKGTAWTPRNWKKVSDDTGIGNPHKSTAEKGKKYAEVVTTELAELFNQIVKGPIYRD